MDPARRRQMLADAREHLKFVCRLCQIQADAGRYYIHEHPHQATSWQETCVLDVQRRTRGQRLVFDMCEYGMTTVTPDGETLPVRKTTGLLTNVPAAAAVHLSNRCQGNHRHGVLVGHIAGVGRRTALAQVYPVMLVRAVLKAVATHKMCDENRMFLLAAADSDENQPGHGLHVQVPPEGEEFVEHHAGFDDVDCKPLNPKEIRTARQEELEYYRSMQAFEVVPTSQCISRI